MDEWGQTFWVPPLTYFYLPKSARAYFLKLSVKNHYLGSGPTSVDPICPQPKAGCDARPSPRTRFTLNNKQLNLLKGNLR